MKKLKISNITDDDILEKEKWIVIGDVRRGMNLDKAIQKAIKRSPTVEMLGLDAEGEWTLEIQKELSKKTSAEDKKDVIQLAKKIKKLLTNMFGTKLRVKTSGSKRPNPWIEVSVIDWENVDIPNEFRVEVVKSIGGKPTNWDNINYGNIRSNSISLHYDEWKKLVDSGVIK